MKDKPTTDAGWQLWLMFEVYGEIHRSCYEPGILVQFRKKGLNIEAPTISLVGELVWKYIEIVGEDWLKPITTDEDLKEMFKDRE